MSSLAAAQYRLDIILRGLCEKYNYSLPEQEKHSSVSYITLLLDIKAVEKLEADIKTDGQITEEETDAAVDFITLELKRVEEETKNDASGDISKALTKCWRDDFTLSDLEKKKGKYPTLYRMIKAMAKPSPATTAPAVAAVPQVLNIQDLPFYIINMPKSVERKARMTKRMEKIGLKDVNFVTAYDTSSEEVKFLGGNAKPWYTDVNQWKRDLACMASHLEALKVFLSSKHRVAVICEDDILFHNSFVRLGNLLIASMPAGTPLLTFGYFLTQGIDQTYIHKVPEAVHDAELPALWSVEALAAHGRKDAKEPMVSPAIPHGLWKMDKDYTWFAGCYFITRQWAAKMYRELHEPVKEKITSEEILRRSSQNGPPGLISAVPLVVEDSISSDRAPQDLPYHVKHNSRWQYSNYSDSDPDQLSPLAKLKPENAHPGFPFKK